jgi:hypothetical protein
LSNGALTVAGLATAAIPFMNEHYILVLYCIIFGFGIGSSVLYCLRNTKHFTFDDPDPDTHFMLFIPTSIIFSNLHGLAIHLGSQVYGDRKV